MNDKEKQIDGERERKRERHLHVLHAILYTHNSCIYYILYPYSSYQ